MGLIDKNHIIRAGLEAIAYQVKDVLSAMEEDSKLELKSLKVDGGAVKNNFLMQFQADILGKNVKKYRTNEASALGAFYLAGLSSGLLKMEDLKLEVEKEFYSLLDEDLINKFYSSWKKAVERSKNWEI